MLGADLGLQFGVELFELLRGLRAGADGGIKIAGAVRGIEGQVEEERFSMVRLEETHCLALEKVCAVGALVGDRGRVVAVHRGHAVAFVGVVVDAGVHESIKVIKPARQRQETFVHAEIPFAKNTAHVAGLFQHGRQQHLARVHAADALESGLVFAGFVLVTVVGRLVTDHVVNTVALWVTSGEKRAA